MKALVLPGKNEPLVVQEKPDLTPGEGEAIIRVYAASLNHRDVWIQKGQYAGLKYPIVPGSDGAGVVVSVNPPYGGGEAGGMGSFLVGGGAEAGRESQSGGAGTAIGASATGSEAWIGRRVIINPAINWGSNQAYQDPKDFRILGLPDDGTFAEYVKVPIQNIIEMPAHLSFEEAAALGVASATAYRAVAVRAGVQPGEKVLITGIGGGVALFALQYAVALGARVYVTSGSGEKIDKAIALGALGGANYGAAGWGQSLQELAGSFDVIIDGAAGDGIDELLNLAAPGGRIVFYGATRGNPSALTARRIFWKQLNILGSTMGSPEDFHSMMTFINGHRIHPVIDKVFPFAEGEAAMRRMDDAHQFGKIVIKVG
jgi:NADPH:quinone reductase-like Zn-dependent oxidoreductase